MKYTNPAHIDNGYIELQGLFVEWEWYHEGTVNEKLEIINVQLPNPADPKDTNKWIEITDNLTDEQKESLAEQVIEMYQDLHELSDCHG